MLNIFTYIQTLHNTVMIEKIENWIVGILDKVFDFCVIGEPFSDLENVRF